METILYLLKSLQDDINHSATVTHSFIKISARENETSHMTWKIGQRDYITTMDL